MHSAAVDRVAKAHLVHLSDGLARAVAGSAVDEVLAVFLELHDLGGKVGRLDVDVDRPLQVATGEFTGGSNVNNHCVSSEFDGFGRLASGKSEGGAQHQGEGGKKLFHG